MKKKNYFPVIVRAVPIVGVWKEVINSKLEIASQVEFYKLDTELYSKTDGSFKLFFPQIMLNILTSKAESLLPLTNKIKDVDFKGGCWENGSREADKEYFKEAIDFKLIGSPFTFNLGNQSNTIDPYLISKTSIIANYQLN